MVTQRYSTAPLSCDESERTRVPPRAALQGACHDLATDLNGWKANAIWRSASRLRPTGWSGRAS